MVSLHLSASSCVPPGLCAPNFGGEGGKDEVWVNLCQCGSLFFQK